MLYDYSSIICVFLKNSDSGFVNLYPFLLFLMAMRTGGTVLVENVALKTGLEECAVGTAVITLVLVVIIESFSFDFVNDISECYVRTVAGNFGGVTLLRLGFP